MSTPSGLAQGSGEYFASVGVGTPPTPALLVLDTGSDVVWLQGAPCRRCYALSGGCSASRIAVAQPCSSAVAALPYNIAGPPPAISLAPLRPRAPQQLQRPRLRPSPSPPPRTPPRSVAAAAPSPPPAAVSKRRLSCTLSGGEPRARRAATLGRCGSEGGADAIGGEGDLGGGEAAAHGAAISGVATHGAASVELGQGVRD
jgi:hypothetical protein